MGVIACCGYLSGLAAAVFGAYAAALRPRGRILDLTGVVPGQRQVIDLGASDRQLRR